MCVYVCVCVCVCSLFGGSIPILLLTTGRQNGWPSQEQESNHLLQQCEEREREGAKDNESNIKRDMVFNVFFPHLSPLHFINNLCE